MLEFSKIRMHPALLKFENTRTHRQKLEDNEKSPSTRLMRTSLSVRRPNQRCAPAYPDIWYTNLTRLIRSHDGPCKMSNAVIKKNSKRMQDKNGQLKFPPKLEKALQLDVLLQSELSACSN